jgi:hypothetical protein
MSVLRSDPAFVDLKGVRLRQESPEPDLFLRIGFL